MSELYFLDSVFKSFDPVVTIYLLFNFILQSFTVSHLREGHYDFPTDAEHPLPPLTVGSSQERARLALELVSEVRNI